MRGWSEISPGRRALVIGLALAAFVGLFFVGRAIGGGDSEAAPAPIPQADRDERLVEGGIATGGGVPELAEEPAPPAPEPVPVAPIEPEPEPVDELDAVPAEPAPEPTTPAPAPPPPPPAPAPAPDPAPAPEPEPPPPDDGGGGFDDSG